MILLAEAIALELFGVNDARQHGAGLCGLRMEAAASAVLTSLRCAHPAELIIVALDGMAPDQALSFAAQVEELRWVKVGLELFVQTARLCWLC